MQVQVKTASETHRKRHLSPANWPASGQRRNERIELPDSISIDSMKLISIVSLYKHKQMKRDAKH